MRVKLGQARPTKFNGCAPSLQTTLTTAAAARCGRSADARLFPVVFLRRERARPGSRAISEFENQFGAALSCVFSRGVTMQTVLSNNSRRAGLQCRPARASHRVRADELRQDVR